MRIPIHGIDLVITATVAGLMVLPQQVNEYLGAFERHDTPDALQTRARYREQVDAARAPSRQRKARRSAAAADAAAEKERRKEAKRAAKAARNDRSRVRRVDDKFQK